MNPASDIIERCGGVATVAAWLGIDRSWVLRWTHPKERGGKGGQIPPKHVPELIRKARENGTEIRIEEVMPEMAGLQ